MHISLVMSVRMLTIDLCSSNMAYIATQTTPGPQQHGASCICCTFACIQRMQWTVCEQDGNSM